MIKATRSAEASLGAEPVAKYRFALSEEHAARLDAILATTMQKPADWLAQILVEECESMGKPVAAIDVAINDPAKGQMTIPFEGEAND